MTIEASGPNTAQIEYWNEVSGPKWVALEAALDEQIAHLGLAAMERASIRAGERVDGAIAKPVLVGRDPALLDVRSWLGATVRTKR